MQKQTEVCTEEARGLPETHFRCLAALASCWGVARPAVAQKVMWRLCSGKGN